MGPEWECKRSKEVRDKIQARDLKSQNCPVQGPYPASLTDSGLNFSINQGQSHSAKMDGWIDR